MRARKDRVHLPVPTYLCTVPHTLALDPSQSLSPLFPLRGAAIRPRLRRTAVCRLLLRLRRRRLRGRETAATLLGAGGSTLGHR